MSEPVRSIGFFGDSFCQDVSTPHSVLGGYKTYLQRLSDHWQADIQCVGWGGSSVWDLVLTQWPQQLNRGVPDVCVMVWTDAHRLYHPLYRNINSSTSESQHTDTHRAAREYYTHLYDRHKHLLEYQALLHHFDCVTLSAYPQQRFIHLWSFGELHPHTGERWYPHEWQHGVTITPALETLIAQPYADSEWPQVDPRANHLESDTANQWIAEQIIGAVEQYPKHPKRIKG